MTLSSCRLHKRVYLYKFVKLETHCNLQCCGSASSCRIRIPDLDPRLQNWYLNFLVYKSIANKFKFIYVSFSVHKYILLNILRKISCDKICTDQDPDPVFFKGRIQIRIRSKMVWIRNTGNLSWWNKCKTVYNI
jgi:hypothetical protein